MKTWIQSHAINKNEMFNPWYDKNTSHIEREKICLKK